MDEKCSVCKEPGTIYCAKCAIDGPGPFGKLFDRKHWYCSKVCEDLDREAHAEDCTNAIKERFFDGAKRAGSIAQTFFYLYLEKTWMHDIKLVFLDGEQINAVAGIGVELGPGGETNNPRFGGGWLCELPALLYMEEHKEPLAKILANGNSRWAFVVMQIAVQLLFKDLVNDIELDIKELVYVPKDNNMRKAVQYFAMDGETPIKRADQVYPDDGECGVFEIDLKNGEKIALDLTCAQWTTPHNQVMPWADFWQKCGREILQRNPVGSALKNHYQLLSGLKMRSHLTINMHILQKFNTWFRNQEQADVKLSTLATEPISFKFKVDKGRIFEKAKSFLADSVADIDSGCSVVASLDSDAPVQTDLRHPLIENKTVFFNYGREMIMHTYGPISSFNWQLMQNIIKGNASYAEKKEARYLLTHRCVYQPLGDDKIVFLKDTFPEEVVPKDNISVNPLWYAGRKG